MTKQELVEVITREYYDGVRWNAQDPGRYFVMMFDTSDGEFWTDCFLDSNTWTTYHSDTIVNVSRRFNEDDFIDNFYPSFPDDKYIDLVADYCISLAPSLFEEC